MYGGALIKKRRYWPNDFDKHFEGKEVGAVDCLEMKTDEGKSSKINCMKETDYVMKLMASWMTLKYLEDANTKRDWKYNGVRKSKQFFYKQPFDVHFRYSNQVGDHNNRWNAPIYIETTWETKFWSDQNSDCYLSVSTVNANLAHVHFQNWGELTPTL